MFILFFIGFLFFGIAEIIQVAFYFSQGNSVQGANIIFAIFTILTCIVTLIIFIMNVYNGIHSPRHRFYHFAPFGSLVLMLFSLGCFGRTLIEVMGQFLRSESINFLFAFESVASLCIFCLLIVGIFSKKQGIYKILTCISISVTFIISIFELANFSVNFGNIQNVTFTVSSIIGFSSIFAGTAFLIPCIILS